MRITPDEAHELVGASYLPVPVPAVFPKIDYDAVEATRPLKRPAVTWSHAKVVRYRRDRTEIVRESLAHELGHACMPRASVSKASGPGGGPAETHDPTRRRPEVQIEIDGCLW